MKTYNIYVPELLKKFGKFFLAANGSKFTTWKVQIYLRFLPICTLQSPTLQNGHKPYQQMLDKAKNTIHRKTFYLIFGDEEKCFMTLPGFYQIYKTFSLSLTGCQ